MKITSLLCVVLIQIQLMGCVEHVYQPGAVDNPLSQVKLGQSYGEMAKILGEPNQSRTEDRMGIETLILFLPVWGLVEVIGDFNPSMMQHYTYDKWGTVTVDNNNHVIRVESK